MEHTGKTSRRRTLRPFEGLRGVTPADLPREISAGFTLAALIIPLNIGYAQVAGLPSTMGLYAAILPLIVFALFTSSRHVVGGPGPATAALVAAALVGSAAPGDALRVQYALALALMCGVLFFLAWVFQLALLQNFLSRAVLIGFVSGLGIQVFTNQIRKILGISVDVREQLETLQGQFQYATGLSLDTQGYFLELIAMVRELPHANLYSVAIGLGSLLAVRAMKRYAPKVPGALVVLAVMTVLVVVLDLNEKGVSVLGTLPAGLPSAGLPAVPMAAYLRMLPGALALVAITLCEGLLLARGYGRKHGYEPDGNQMLFAYGVTNVVAGLGGSMVSGNSVSRSAAMDSGGARSQLPSLVAAGVVAVILAFFTDVLALLPNAALAGIVANAVLSLIEVGNLRELYRIRRSEFWIATTCIVAVLVVGPLRAVAIAFLLSVIDLLGRSSRPVTAVLRESADCEYFRSDGDPAAESAPGLLVYRFTAPVYFANASVIAEETRKLVDRAPSPVRWFVLDAAAILDMDTAGAEVLRQVLALLTERNITFAISRASGPLRSVLDDYGLMDEIGRDRFYETNRDAAAEFRHESSST